MLKERETKDDDLGMASSPIDVEMMDRPPSQATPRHGRRQAPHRLDKRQIEQRIEEDRERHKRERESIWAVPRGDDAEMNKLWEETSDFGEDDERLVMEEEEDFDKEMELQQCPHKRPPTNGQSH